MEKVKELTDKGWVNTKTLAKDFLQAIRKSANRLRLAQEKGISVSQKRENGEDYIKFETIKKDD